MMLVSDGANLEQTTQAWAQEMLKEDGNESSRTKTFGDPQRAEAIIHLVTEW